MTNIPYTELLLAVNIIVLMIASSLSSSNQLNIAQMLKTIADKIDSLETSTKEDVDNAS
ncbi:unnamed protein product [marine sediment metagenome]|uniref:Uncharacterized protein n=1 Tax=marine sediment metagenome TaxID=412755 RepID=X1ANB4_9ZZZZ